MFSLLEQYFTYNDDRNIVELFKPLYILLSITGLFPCTVEFPKGRHDSRITRKPFKNYLGAIILIAFLSFYFTQRIQILIHAPAVSSVTKISNIIEISLALLCDIVIYISAFQYANTYLEILRNIAACWADLSLANVTPIIAFLRRIFTYPVFAWLVIFPSVQITLCIIGTQKVYNQLIFWTVPDAIPSLIVAFYSSMVLFVVGLLKNIEQHCQMIVGAKNRRVENVFNILGPNVRTVSPVVWSPDSCIRLSYLEVMFVRVLEIKQAINTVFQAPIALIIIQCFHGILSDSHTVYRALVVNMTFEAHLLLDQTFWVLYSLAKVFALTFTGSMMKDEAVKIGQGLHNIPTENKDNRMLMEVQHFATLMSFRKPVVTVYDCFSLDATLLFSMIATAVTYLVILVQFDTA